MNPLASPNFAGAAPEMERRRHGRFLQDGLQSSLGPVVDISAGGIRILSRRRLNGTLPITLRSPSGMEISLNAHVVWSRRKGFRRFLIGLEFIDVNPKTQKQLTRIGMGH